LTTETPTPWSPTGNLIGVVVELASGMQNGEDDLGRGSLLFGMDVDGDTATVVDHRHRPVTVQDHADVGAMSGQCLVDGVVDDLENHVVEAGSVVGIADIHARALSDCVESTEDFDVR
jgi:hypothetical protein